MSQQPAKPDRTLSEISHLFLSSVRERQTRGTPLPQRRPPSNSPMEGAQQGQPIATRHLDGEIDLTPEEFAQMSCGTQPAQVCTDAIPVELLLTSHLGTAAPDGARQYASYLCRLGGRIGLIEVDASEFRLCCFEPAAGDGDHPPLPGENVCPTLDARPMTEALHELAHDVDHWLVVCTPRATEAQTLARKIDKWVLLASCDHDGIVAAYRALKGLAESQHRRGAGELPRLSLMVLDVGDDEQAEHASSKLAGVCEQFLNWKIDSRIRLSRTHGAGEHLVLECRATRDKAQLAAAPQWQVVLSFLDHLKTIAPRKTGTGPVFGAGGDSAAKMSKTGTGPVFSTEDGSASKNTGQNAPHVAQKRSGFAETGPVPVFAVSGKTGTDSVAGASSEVLDLPAGEDMPRAIVTAVLREGGDLIECPIHPPMCPEASLAVSRQRQLVLVAVAQQGLSDLRAIAQAYRWLNENRPLISMAVPQFAIDSQQRPRLHLLIDHTDMSADILQPMFESENVTVRAYRKLHWGGKTGLLLEAA